MKIILSLQLCLGYKYSFPFLNIECGIHVKDNTVQPLYKHIFNIRYPSMVFIGLIIALVDFQLMDLQVREKSEESNQLFDHIKLTLLFY